MVQKINLGVVTSSEDDIYFMVDNRNSIHILYPICDVKMELVELIEKIRRKANILEITSAINCNRINSFMQHEDRYFSKENVVQETSHLRKILKIPDLTKDMVLTFCAEKEKFF